MEYSLLTVIDVTSVPPVVVRESVTVVVTTVLLCSFTEMMSTLLPVEGVESLVTVVVVVVTVDFAQFSVEETTVCLSPFSTLITVFDSVVKVWSSVYRQTLWLMAGSQGYLGSYLQHLKNSVNVILFRSCFFH